MAMTMNDIDNTFGVYYYDIFHDINQDRIILMSEEIDDENYGSIHNTLTILELGHMVYNLHYICSCFNSSIRIQIKSRYVLVDLVEDEQVKREIKKYNQLAQLRSSGSYSNKLINFSLDHSAYRYVSVIDRKKVFKQLFNQELNDVIEVLEFINTGICFWNEEYDIQISFEELNAQYDFVDFKSATQYTLFLINKEYISTKLLKNCILYIGYLAQEICFENSQIGVYNRPVKQVLTDFWDGKVEENISLSGYTSFYGVITGKESSTEGRNL